MYNWRELVCKRLADIGIDPVADASLIEELAQHMEDRYAEVQAQGGATDDAFAAALRELDNHGRLTPALAKNRPAPVPPAPIGGPPLRSRFAALWQDFRYAARTLRRSPGFTLVAVMTVALSTAPTIAVLSVGNWLFLRPSPGVAQPERLMTVMFGVPSERGGLTVLRPSYDHIAELASACPSIESMAGWQRTDLSIAVEKGDAHSVDGEFVSGNYFDALGVRMFAGRSFFADEDRPPDGVLVAVISYRLSRDFGGSIAVGARVTVNRYPVTVIGIAPPNFAGSGSVLNSADIWMPGQAAHMIQHLAPEARRPDRGPFYEYVIRLAPDVSYERAGTELRNALEALSHNDPGAAMLRNVQPRARPGFARPPDNFRALIATLLGLGIFLVLIAAANLANMFGFRAVRRVPETALRRALGASSRRLFQASIAESVIVAAIGCLAGLVIVSIARTLVGGTVLAGGFYFPEIPFDWRLMGMTVGLAFCTGIFMGVSSARFTIRLDLAAIIAGSGRTATRTVSRLRTGLAVVQMALSLTLLVGAVLFIGTLRNLRALDLGFDPKGMTAYALSFRTQGYTPERIALLYSELLEKLSAMPGITAAAVAYGSPMFGGEIGMGRNFNPLGDREEHRYAYSQVSPGYFDALGITMITGQGFSAEEPFRPGPETGVVISESLARHLYGTTAAVGHLLEIPKTPSEPQHDVRIVGVAEDVRWDDLAETPPFMIYRPIRAASVLNSRLLVRSTDRTEHVISGVRDAVKSLDSALPMQWQIMEEVVSLKLGQQRTFAWVLGLLAAIGFALAAIGIHGLVSQSVVERNREFGIRLAVGAGPREIVGLVLRSALCIVVVGAPLGCALALMLALGLRNRLFGVTPLDFSAYVAAIGALVLVVLAATLWPAYSASRANPSEVLRAE
jgi:putative ABC transport system permease protein